jgi:small nuclear ribonucleoprotein (snRNP)-like protein
LERVLRWFVDWIPQSGSHDEYQFCCLVGNEEVDGHLRNFSDMLNIYTVDARRMLMESQMYNACFNLDTITCEGRGGESRSRKYCYRLGKLGWPIAGYSLWWYLAS